jgi:hypothetical protein
MSARFAVMMLVSAAFCGVLRLVLAPRSMPFAGNWGRVQRRS